MVEHTKFRTHALSEGPRAERLFKGKIHLCGYVHYVAGALSELLRRQAGPTTPSMNDTEGISTMTTSKARLLATVLLFFLASAAGADCDQPLATCSPAADSAEINPKQDCTLQPGGDDTDLIQAAINTGIPVVLPAGLFSIDAKAGKTEVLCLLSGTHLRGAGLGATVLQLGSRGGHMMSGGVVQDVTLRDFTLIGNRGAQTVTGTHGIRLGDATRIRIQDVSIHDTEGYGIGLQVSGEGGAFDNVVIRGVLIEDPGSDGIDIKNRSNANRALIISDTTVTRPGRIDSTDAGIDVRGPATLSNIHIRGLDVAQRGVRFRNGEMSDSNGLGGHQASMSNFHISSEPGSTSIGVSIVARDVNLANGNIEGGARGIVVNGPCVGDPPQCEDRSNANIVNVTVRRATQIGFLFGADTARCQACSAVDGTAEGFRITGSNTLLANLLADGNGTQGVRVLNTASGALVLGGDVRGNGTGLGDGAADTRVRDVLGYCQTGDPDCP